MSGDRCACTASRKLAENNKKTECFLDLSVLSLHAAPEWDVSSERLAAPNPIDQLGRATAIGMPTKRTLDDQPTLVNFATVHVLGAVLGQTIRGITEADVQSGLVARPEKVETLEHVKGVVLRVTRGAFLSDIAARATARLFWEERAGMSNASGWAVKLGQTLGMSHDQASALIDLTQEVAIDNPKGFLGVSGDLVQAGSAPMHVLPGGSSPLFEIVEPGAWGKYDSIMELVDAGKPISPHQLWHALNDGKKTLGDYVDPETGKKVNLPGPYAMRGLFFVHQTVSNQVQHTVGERIDVEVAGALAPAEPAEYYDVLGETTKEGVEKKLRLKLPPSGAQLTPADVPSLVKRAIQTFFSEEWMVKSEGARLSILYGLSQDRALLDAEAAFNVLNSPTITAGALKSLLQKVIRCGAAKTRIPNSELVDSRIVVMVTIGLLNAIKSSFVPDLATHVRGSTAAFKRLAIIMVEDAWPQAGMLRGLGAIDARARRNPARALAALMGVALATTRLSEWTPPE
jgi:hypothetical protein